jgi:hypothetical protein
MFVVCLECFRVIAEQRPLGSSAVIPSICPACRAFADMNLGRLGLPTRGLVGPCSAGHQELSRERERGQGTERHRTPGTGASS